MKTVPLALAALLLVLPEAPAQVTTRVNVSSSGEQADQPTPVLLPRTSDDGRYVVFESAAGNLVPGDTNGFPDLFVNGPELNLQLEPGQATPGGPLQINAWGALAGSTGVLFAVSANGALIFQHLHTMAFDAAGRHSVAVAVPNDPALSGTWFELQMFATGGTFGRFSSSPAVEFTVL